MLPVISFVGESKSGKTTLLKLLIAELRSRGHRLAAIKHTHHGDFTLDQPGKDSWQLYQAGCDAVILSSPAKMALIRRANHDTALEELLCLIDGDVDLVIAEGFKQARVPKIEVHRKGGGALVCPPDQILAVVTDEVLDIAVPQYAHDDTKGLADLVESSVLASAAKDQVSLEVNGDCVSVNPFVSQLLNRTIVGMISTLKDVGEVNSLHIWLRREKG